MKFFKHNYSPKEHKLNLLALLLFVITGVLIVGMASYHYPRDIVDVTQPVILSKPGAVGEKSYVPGEEISGIFEVENRYDSIVTFKRELICDVNGTEINYSFGEIDNFPVQKTDKQTRIAVIGILPLNIESDRCKIAVTALYEVEVFPYLTKIYTETFYTNEFNVER